MSEHDPFGEPTAPLPAQPFGAQQPPGLPPMQRPPIGGSPGAPSPSRPPSPSGARVPAWLLPIVAVTALLLGLLGGLLGGALVGAARTNTVAGSGVGLKVQERQAPPLPADNQSVPAVAQKVLPSTVQILAEYNGQAEGATGSGWILDDRGHIITNNHVVASAAKDHGPIEVIDQSGRHFKASIVGRSAVYDLAVLQSDDAKKLTPMALGSAQQMRVGETVVAFGSPLGLSSSVTSGIISALNRPVTTGDGGDENSYINAVQTDAAINPGNSGGPLVDLQGEVVGVNSAIASLGSKMTSDQGGNIGVGFAIPIEQVETTADQILRTGSATYPIIGAGVRGTPTLDGATITSVTSGMPAAAAGLREGDLVRKIDGKAITSSIDLVVAIRTHVPGDKVTLTIERGGKTREVRVGLAGKTG